MLRVIDAWICKHVDAATEVAQWLHNLSWKMRLGCQLCRMPKELWAKTTTGWNPITWNLDTADLVGDSGRISNLKVFPVAVQNREQ